MLIDLYSVEAKSITQRVAIYPAVEEARADYSEEIQFPGETEIEGWSFSNSKADEEKFSCFTYSNLDYPICTWWARYQEIMVEVIGRLEPGHLTLEEMQTVIQTIDGKVAQKMNDK